jgi:hypothetical protein
MLVAIVFCLRRSRKLKQTRALPRGRVRVCGSLSYCAAVQVTCFTRQMLRDSMSNTSTLDGLKAMREDQSGIRVEANWLH